MVLEQPGVHDTDGLVEELELVPESHFVDSELVLLSEVGGDFLFEEIDG